MTRNEIKLLALTLLFVALTAARIVAAQKTPEQADQSPPVSAGSHAVWSRAAEDRDVDDATVLVLAQAMVAEAGFDARDDHAAIAHILARNADRLGVPLIDYAVRYVSLLRVNDDGRHIVQSERAAWVRDLSLDARKPQGWPSNLAWSAHVDRWLRVVDVARSFVADPSSVADPCARERPRHWGDRRGDKKRAERAGWVLARCSVRTRNAVWVAR